MYDALVAAHVICAVVGFGAVALSGVYGGFTRRPPAADGGDVDARPGGGAGGVSDEVARYFSSPGWAEWLLIPVPFLGAAAFAAGPSKGGFGQVWLVGGIVIWLLAAALLVLVVRPSEARIRRGDLPVASGRRLMWSAVASDVLFVVALALMVTQPR